jgi:hypothetical protein
MRHTASRSIAALVAGVMLVTALPFTAAQAASPKAKQPQLAPASDTVTDISARRRYRNGGNPAAALAAFGLIAGTIATIAANDRRRDYYDRGYGNYGAPRAYGYGYGYPQRGYRYW